MNKQKKSVYIVFALAFLWLPAFGLTAWAQEARGAETLWMAPSRTWGPVKSPKARL